MCKKNLPKFQNFITDEVNDTRKKVTCKAHVKIDVNAAKDFMYLIGRVELKDTLEFKSGEELTEKNIEEIFIRTAEKTRSAIICLRHKKRR